MMQPRNKRIKLTSESGVVQKPQVIKSNPSRGVLRDLLEMPMGILHEVLYCLRPLDLLRVSRINKVFRNLLMHRSSAHIWRESRRNVPGLLGPFPGMSKPAFASLCFDTLCLSLSRMREAART